MQAKTQNAQLTLTIKTESLSKQDSFEKLSLLWLLFWKLRFLQMQMQQHQQQLILNGKIMKTEWKHVRFIDADFLVLLVPADVKNNSKNDFWMSLVF